MPHFRDRPAAGESVELHHLEHFLPLLLAQWNHRSPAHPAVAGEKEIEAQKEKRDEGHPEAFVHEPEPPIRNFVFVCPTMNGLWM